MSTNERCPYATLGPAVMVMQCVREPGHPDDGDNSGHIHAPNTFNRPTTVSVLVGALPEAVRQRVRFNMEGLSQREDEPLDPMVLAFIVGDDDDFGDGNDSFWLAGYIRGVAETLSITPEELIKEVGACRR